MQTLVITPSLGMGTSQMHLLIATPHLLPVSRCLMLTPMAPLVRATEEASETRTGLAVGDAARPDALLHAARGNMVPVA